MDHPPAREPEPRYPDLYPPFVWASFLLAIVGGFGLAAHLSVVVGYGLPAVRSPLALMQAHGHLQLFGWIGLLLFGVSLYVLPRLTSSPLRSAATPCWVFRCALVGVLLRALAPVIGVYLAHEGQRVLLAVTFVGAVLEAVAIGLYLAVITTGVRAGRIDRPELRRLGPYFLPMVLGWAIVAVGGVLVTGRALFSGGTNVDSVWLGVLNDVFIHMVIVAAILGFGVKMLPIFLGLRPPLWPVRTIGVYFAVGTFIGVGCRALAALGVSGDGLLLLEVMGTLCLSTALLWYTWELDALLFRVIPERVSLKQFRGDVAQQRGRFGDRGEFGRFELFIIVGFGWLVVVALAEVVNGLLALFQRAPAISPFILRHMLLVGFVAHVVFGVGHRLLPNLLHTRLRNPALTTRAFVLLTLAALLRTVPLILRDYGVGVSQHFFALSGVLGLLAVILFAVNVRGSRAAAILAPTKA